MAVKCIDCNKQLNNKNVHVKRCRKCYYHHIGSDPSKPWLNKEWLIKQYYDRGLSFASIAKLCGVNPSTIDHAFTDKFKLKSRKNMVGISGKHNPSWKGGFTMINGYVMIYHPKDHPRKSCKNYVPKHVLVIEEKIGRKLTKGECVHHKNGIKTDNRFENLQILSNKEHRKLGSQLEHFAQQIIYGDLTPHLKRELLQLFTSYLSKND